MTPTRCVVAALLLAWFLWTTQRRSDMTFWENLRRTKMEEWVIWLCLIGAVLGVTVGRYPEEADPCYGINSRSCP